MKTQEEIKFKKVQGQVFDPSRDVTKSTNVLNNINIADNLTTEVEKKSFTQIAGQTSMFSAQNRDDKEIKSSLKSIN